MPTFEMYRGGKGAGKSYLKTCNMDLREGAIRPSDRQARFAISGNSEAAQTIISGRRGLPSQPAPWFAVAGKIYYFRSGAVGNYDLTAVVKDICPVADQYGGGGMLVCYGSGTYVDLFRAAGTHTSSTTVSLAFATMVDDTLYGAGCGSGSVSRTVASSYYYVSICPAGSNPLDATNWSDGIPVGEPGQPITCMGSLNGAALIAKTDGLYVWKDTQSKYVNILEFKFAVHEDNGKGMFVGKGNAFYPTGDGGLWKFDGYNVEDVSPKNATVLHRDAPHLRAPITAGCVTGDYVYVATAPWELGWSQEHGLTVVKALGGTSTYTDLTTECTDGDLATGGDVAGMGDPYTDFICVGADVPFEAVKFVPGTPNSATTTYGLGVRYVSTDYDTTDGWQLVSVATDNTMVAGATLGTTGHIRLLDTQDYGCHKLMSKTTNGGTLSSKYWARFTVTGTPISASTTIAEVYILPSRPPIKYGTYTAGIASAAVTNGNFEYTGPDAAGIFPHILAGHVVGGDWQWDDVYTLQTTAPIRAMALCQVDTGQAEENAGPRLLALSRRHLHVILMGQPAMQGSPVNENYADGVSMGTPVVWFLPTDLSTSGTDRFSTQKQVSEHHIYGEYVDSSDALTVFQRFDHNQWDEAGQANNAPTRVAGGRGQEGLILETAIGYEDVDVEVAGPRITGYDVVFKDVDGAFDAHPQRDAQAVEVE